MEFWSCFFFFSKVLSLFSFFRVRLSVRFRVSVRIRVKGLRARSQSYAERADWSTKIYMY